MGKPPKEPKRNLNPNPKRAWKPRTENSGPKRGKNFISPGTYLGPVNSFGGKKKHQERGQPARTSRLNLWTLISNRYRSPDSIGDRITT